jgi:hypothetical protein
MAPDDDRIERLVHRALRDLPDRPAPRDLAGRVLSEVGRRSALPWWRLPHSRWPGPARAAFLAVSGAAGLSAAAGVAWATDRAFQEALGVILPRLLDRMALLPSVASDGAEAFAAVAGAVPAVWTTGLFAAATAGFAILAVLGATAYRRLSRP